MRGRVIRSEHVLWRRVFGIFHDVFEVFVETPLGKIAALERLMSE
jgi:hypothetical protein